MSKCGYESPKTRAVPCRNTICPKCETPLCGVELKIIGDLMSFIEIKNVTKTFNEVNILKTLT